MPDRECVWPALPFDMLSPTLTTLQLWTQIVGKIRLRQTPWVNHSWHVALYVSARGLTTGLIPHGNRGFELEFDLISHVLELRVSDGGLARVDLEPGSVAGFYGEVLRKLAALGVAVEINTHPNEMPDPIPFPRDTAPRAYDPDLAHRFWLVLVQCDRVFKLFRTRFVGKCSPVHFFWGSFDLAVTRFSGRGAPPHPGGVPYLPDGVAREAYSHEVSSAGFWPGSGGFRQAAFYSYCYPTPAGFAETKMSVAEAWFEANLGEFVLPYDAVRKAGDPDGVLLRFLQETYEGAALTGGWDRGALECDEGVAGRPRAV